MKRVGSRLQVMRGTAKQTGGGLRKRDLKYNKHGKIVSKKVSTIAKKNLKKGGYKIKNMIGGKFFNQLEHYYYRSPFNSKQLNFRAKRMIDLDIDVKYITLYLPDNDIVSITSENGYLYVTNYDQYLIIKRTIRDRDIYHIIKVSENIENLIEKFLKESRIIRYFSIDELHDGDGDGALKNIKKLIDKQKVLEAADRAAQVRNNATLAVRMQINEASDAAAHTAHAATNADNGNNTMRHVLAESKRTADANHKRRAAAQVEKNRIFAERLNANEAATAASDREAALKAEAVANAAARRTAAPRRSYGVDDVHEDEADGENERKGSYTRKSSREYGSNDVDDVH